jgi:methionyl-tRNA formyltransferase
MIAPEFIVSYNYRYILPKSIIDVVNGQAINLHISLLPYNKGSHPNVWSFLEDTPKGVTIHYIDEGIDTGDILIQREVYIDENRETLKSAYEILHHEIQMLFCENWQNVKNNSLISKLHQGGTIHFRREYQYFEPYIREKGWDTPIREFKARYQMDLKAC